MPNTQTPSADDDKPVRKKMRYSDAGRPLYIVNEPLTLPPDVYRLDLHSATFETPERARVEDLIKADLFDTDMVEEYSERKIRLLSQLRAPFGGRKLKTMASSQDMYFVRQHVLGNVWRLIDETLEQGPRLFSLTSRWWECDDVGRDDVDGMEFMDWLDFYLNEVGCDQTDGYLIAFMRCVEDASRERWKFHVDGVVCGEMLNAVDRLRKLDFFWSTEREGATVTIDPNPIADIATSLTALLTPNWTTVRRGPVTNDGKLAKNGDTESLVSCLDKGAIKYLNRCRLDKCTIIKNLKVLRDGRLKVVLP